MNDEHQYCKECGGFVEYDTSRVLTSAPPQYKGVCSDCGEVRYTSCDLVRSVCDILDREVDKLVRIGLL